MAYYTVENERTGDISWYLDCTTEYLWLDLKKIGTKWKIWILPFQGYAQNFCSCSGLVAALFQSHVVFDSFPKMALFASAESLIFALFFSKCCHLEHNEDKHMKPTLNVYYFPKFLWEERSILISPTAFELFNFEKWPQVVQQNLKYGEESSPVLSFSTAQDTLYRHISKFW